MKVILGLGNPGNKYAKTRHNVGYQTIEGLAKRLGFSFNKAKFHALIAEGQVGEEKILLAKPTSFMNLSGIAAAEILNFYKLQPKDLLVIYDDVDLEIGDLRLRKSGGAGTHNGMKDIISRIGSKDFPRLRLGIGQDPRIPLASFVLSRFSDKEEVLMDQTMEEALDALEVFLDKGMDAAMNSYNRRS